MSNDAVLKPYLEASTPEEASRELEKVLFQVADPLVRRIVGFRLGATATPQDREDTIGDVILELVSRLEAQRASGDGGDPIANFSAYSAVAAHHGCDRYLRRRFPQRHRLKNRLRHMLETSREYAIWPGEEGDRIAGVAKWKGAPPVKGLPPDWVRNVPMPAGVSAPQVVASIFTVSGGPLRLGELVDAAAHLLDLRDEPAAPLEELATATRDPGERIDQRRRLERVWAEIAELPSAHALALLLNLRDERGDSPLAAFPAAGIASIRQIAAKLEMPAAELAGLWGKLPLSDLEIAARMGLTRQQVINMRQAARQRLVRRGSGNIAPISASTKGKEV